MSIAGILVAEGGLGFTSAEAEIWIKLKVQKLTILEHIYQYEIIKICILKFSLIYFIDILEINKYKPLTSTSISIPSFSPFMGSDPFSLMYFSIRRLS